ncbi:MAG: Gfo/Idh/MocA family oxidoreductase, partial [Panacagrimonas sp.]
MSESVVRIGLIGLGNVGQGVINVLRTNAGDIERRLGRKMVVTKASARDLSRPRQVSVDGIELVSDPFAIVRDPEVDLVVEAIGGQQPAKDLIVAALEAGKPVATANKALLAEDGNSIFAAAAKAGAMVAFE